MAIQTRTRVTKGKAKNIDACADDRGIIRAAAMDQRGSLMREIGKQGGAATPESLTEFKTAVTKALTPYATAILMDPEYGLPALKAKAPRAGVLLAYKRGMDEKGLEFAKRKPEAVKKYMATFSESRFGIDVLKVEVPVNMAFVQGSKANKSGDVAYTKADALRHFKEAADAATKPF